MTSSHDILDRLITFETVSDRSNLEMMEYISAFLKARGFRLHPLPDAEEAKAGLLAEIGPGTEGGLLLSAHSDVVPVAGQAWTKPPFKLTREGGRFYGRGTTDMKGFLAEMLALADAVHTRDLAAPLKLVISYDEEIGCVGIARMRERLEPLLGQPKLAIVGEPTEMDVAIAHKGKRSYRAEITGQAGHSAMAPRFVSALHVAVDYVTALRQLQDDIARHGARNAQYDIPYTTIHVGRMESGRALNIVPDHAKLLFEFRHLAEDNPDDLEARLHALAGKVAGPHAGSAEIKLHPLSGYPGLAVPENDAAVSLVRSWCGNTTRHVAFGTEAGVLSELGIPTIVCGPGSMEGQGHKPDEFVTEAQLAACAQMLRKGAQELLLA